MAQKTYLFKGKAKWAKVYQAEPEYDKTKSSWRIDLYLDDSSWDTFEASGLQLKVREDKVDGTKFVKFSRPTRKIIKDKIVEPGPPEVVNSDKEPMTDLIGNGSTVTCKVIVYDTAKGKGHTLEAIRVDELVKYEKPEDEMADDVVPF